MGVIWTLSGFLGTPRDWEFLRPLPLQPWSEEAVVSADDSIIGYSMGGRLALALLERHPFRKGVIVSAALNAPDDARRQRDEEWASRFESEDWESLMRGWNAQPVFGGHVLDRRESDYDRVELARQLREWSPAVLPPPRLEEIHASVLWVAGERDPRYVGIGQAAVRRLPHAELWVCPGAGHRVPWEQPDAFRTRLHAFLELQ